MKHSTTDAIIDRAQREGKRYTPALLPSDIKRGPMGKCFDWCVLVAMHSKGKYRYVEGIALDPRMEKGWILHAWLTDGVQAFDPTWKCLDPENKEVPMPTVYFGIEMDIQAVAEFMLTTEYCCVLENGWRAPDLAKKCPLDCSGH